MIFSPCLILFFQAGKIGFDNKIATVEDLTFIGDLGKSDSGIIFVGKFGIGVIMIPQLIAELFLKKDPRVSLLIR